MESSQWYEALEAEFLKGLDSGPATPMTQQDWRDIREEVRRREAERLEIELMKGLKGKEIAMTPEAFKRMRAEAAKIIKSKRT